MKDTRSRKWQLTINNPKEKGLPHEQIKVLLSQFKSLVYWCMSDEVGEEGTYHTHIFLACSDALRFSTIKNKFQQAHFEMAKGTSKENRDYIFKQGKWEKDKKRGTNLTDTHEEYGEMPIERQGQRNDLIDLYDMIKSDMTNYEIIEENPAYMVHFDKIEKARQLIKEERYKNVFRELKVTYRWGDTNCGKSRSVTDAFGLDKVYRVTDWTHPFDNYKGEDVIVFEEFRGQLRIDEMLNYLDGYPLQLPCRYANKIACFTQVFITTNIPLTSQYIWVQRESPETWDAFCRRIHNIEHMVRQDKSTEPIEEFHQISVI